MVVKDYPYINFFMSELQLTKQKSPVIVILIKCDDQEK